MLELQRAREAAAERWPLPEAELLPALAELARADMSIDSHVGLVLSDGTPELGWLSISVVANVLADGSAQARPTAHPITLLLL